MRIWDIPVSVLCRNHLLGEHRELHAMWNVLTLGKKGYSHHPETLRWKGKLKALYLRHQEEVKEMETRGYNHKSPLPIQMATGKNKQDTFVDTISAQKKNLLAKGCECRVK
ncbi:MAG: pyrimidine dimer DNA glycosylase [Candidatus Omnitrophica bacterium]|nr:pyrimidine dimer DNA glycosylase [Candidatus Omnitrophota bacterium]